MLALSLISTFSSAQAHKEKRRIASTLTRSYRVSPENSDGEALGETPLPISLEHRATVHADDPEPLG